MQGPKLTFLGRHQLAKYFFSRQMEKFGRQKVLTKIFLGTKTLIDRKLWSPIIRTKRTRLGTQWRFFHKRIRLNTNTLIIIYASTTEKPCQTNRTLTIYAVSCDYQMFQVNFVPSFVADRKTAVWFCVQTIFPFAFCQDDLRVTMLLTPGHSRAAPEPSTIRMLSVCYWKPQKKHGDEASHY